MTRKAKTHSAGGGAGRSTCGCSCASSFSPRGPSVWDAVTTLFSLTRKWGLREAGGSPTDRQHASGKARPVTQCRLIWRFQSETFFSRTEKTCNLRKLVILAAVGNRC